MRSHDDHGSLCQRGCQARGFRLGSRLLGQTLGEVMCSAMSLGFRARVSVPTGYVCDPPSRSARLDRPRPDMTGQAGCLGTRSFRPVCGWPLVVPVTGASESVSHTAALGGPLCPRFS